MNDEQIQRIASAMNEIGADRDARLARGLRALADALDPEVASPRTLACRLLAELPPEDLGLGVGPAMIIVGPAVAEILREHPGGKLPCGVKEWRP